jgi:hypothetical protein
MTKTKSDRARGMWNWAVLVVLVAIAAGLYVGIILKASKSGF